MKKNKNLFLKLNSNLNINYCNKIFYKSDYEKEYKFILKVKFKLEYKLLQ
jgi:hypothetical protein